jgi:hypothetical protein
MSVEPVPDRVAAHPFSDHGRRFGRLSLEEYIEQEATNMYPGRTLLWM